MASNLTLTVDVENSSLSGNISDNVTEELNQQQQIWGNFQDIVAIVVPIFFSIVVVVGFCGNLLVILVVLLNKQMRNTTNLLILNLAVGDLLFIICCVPFTATTYASPEYWPFGDYWCKVVQFLIYFTALVSIYTLVLMSLDRYLAVVYPIESITLRTEANCKIAISATWIICAVAGSPLIFANGVDVSEVGSKSFCVFLDNQTLPFIPQEWDLRWRQDAFNIGFFVGGYLFPLILIIILYTIMLNRLWKQGPGGHASAESIRNKKRVVKMVLIVIIIFAFWWLPIQVILVLRSLKMYPINVTSITIQIISLLFAYSNSCVNPILYAFLSEPFRRGFCAVVNCIRPAGPHGFNGHNENGAATNRTTLGNTVSNRMKMTSVKQKTTVISETKTTTAINNTRNGNQNNECTTQLLPNNAGNNTNTNNADQHPDVIPGPNKN